MSEHTISTAPVEPPAGRDSIWANQDFVKLWAGETVSLIGTQITQFTLPLVAILTPRRQRVRGRPAECLPLRAGGRGVAVRRGLAGPPPPPAGADRLQPRQCRADRARADQLMASGVLSIGLLYAVCLLVGVLTVVFDVGVLSYVPTPGRRRHLGDSNGQHPDQHLAGRHRRAGHGRAAGRHPDCAGHPDRRRGLLPVLGRGAVHHPPARGRAARPERPLRSGPNRRGAARGVRQQRCCARCCPSRRPSTSSRTASSPSSWSTRSAI